MAEGRLSPIPRTEYGYSIIVLCLLLFPYLSDQSSATQVSPTDERAVVVGRVTLTHADNLSIADREFVVREVTRHHYKSTDLDEIAERVRYAFQWRGYFKVLVHDQVFTIASNDRRREIVDVRMSVEQGGIYRLKDIRFKSVSVFTPAELRRQFRIVDGDIFDRQKIAAGLEYLRRLYGTKGYVNFSAVPDTEVDEKTHTVSLMIDLDTGTVFHVGKLTVLGEESEPGAREKLLKAWKAYEGQVYDYRILTQFLRDLHALPNVKPDDVFEISQDFHAGAINVQIILVKPYTLSSSSDDRAK